MAAASLMDTLPFRQGILVVGVALGLHSLLVGFLASHHTARYVRDVALQEKRQAADKLAQSGDTTARWAMYPAWIPGMHFLSDVFVLLLITFSKAKNNHWAASLPAFLVLLKDGKEFLRRMTAKAGGAGAEIEKEGVAKSIPRKGARNIVRAMANHYRQGQAIYESRGLNDLPALCRDVIMSRYRGIPPSEKEFAVLRCGIERVEDFCDAAFLVVLAEGDVDRDLDPSLYQLYAEEVASEVARLEGNKNPEHDTSARERVNALIEKFPSIRTDTSLQDPNEVREHLQMLKTMRS